MVVLDTDLLSLLERDEPPAEQLRSRLARIGRGEVVTTVVNFEEQMRGWLAVVAHARTVAAQIEAYRRLARFVENYRDIPVLAFNERAAVEYQRLRKQYRRLGTMDLKIAAIAIVHGATLITRNLSDFRQISELRAEDWSSRAS